MTEVRETVSWQIRNQPPRATWFLTINIAGRSYDVARVEALDRDAAAKAITTQVELALALNQFRARSDEEINGG